MDGLARIRVRVSEIKECMNQNMFKLLKMNDDKTEPIMFTSKYKQDFEHNDR